MFERALDEKYSETLTKMRQERSLLAQQNGFLQLQQQQAHDQQAQMREHYEKEAQKLID